MPRQITTLLVANRGEIASRVIRTARGMGIRTVAVYSVPDARSPHVREADRAVPLHGSTPAESYLNAHKLLEAARISGADALHPGYGFLSEDPDFAQACVDAGLVFVGPTPRNIRDMALKDRAKEIARAAGVPVLPDAEVPEDRGAWLGVAADVGYPLLVKAIAGGGGKGMRRVDMPDALVDAIEAARREAASSFGNSAVFLERYLQSARHVEIQVLGDDHGNAVHLGERECSIQRRHQKVLEESPSAAVDSVLRARMGETAVALVRELEYRGAGTVEYLLEETSTGPEFYFLEMNTRLQVEHPVTEEVTGIDLVRLQLDIAAGLPLALHQDDIAAQGHAIEVRLYAEDPARGFLPTPGRLHTYTHAALPGLRYDDGVAAPADISPYYDPMLAKVIAHAPGRREAALRLASALEAMEIHGVVTNRDFLVAILRDADFLAANTFTDFIDRHPELLTDRSPTPWVVHLAAAVAVAVAGRRRSNPQNGAAPGWRVLSTVPLTHASWERAGRPAEEAVGIGYRLTASSGRAQLTLEVADATHALMLHDLTADGVVVEHEGLERHCTVRVSEDGVSWVNDGEGQSGWRAMPRLPSGSSHVTERGPVAELPGTVVAVFVSAGDVVVAGQRLVMMEAMKMEHPTVAATESRVDQVHVSLGDYVDAGTVLVSLTPVGTGDT